MAAVSSGVPRFHSLHHPRISGLGHRGRVESDADEERFAIEPGSVALRLRQAEAVGDELLRLQVELADHVGIGAAAGKRHERPGVVRRQGLCLVPHPVLVLRLPQGIEIEHGLPGGLGLAVLHHGGAPPEAAFVLLVLPEVVVVGPDLVHVGDLGVGIEDLQDAGAHLLERLRAGELAGALGVSRLDPGQGFLAGDVFEPEVGILRGCGLRHGKVRRGKDGGHENGARAPEGGATGSGEGRHGTSRCKADDRCGLKPHRRSGGLGTST